MCYSDFHHLTITYYKTMVILLIAISLGGYCKGIQRLHFIYRKINHLIQLPCVWFHACLCLCLCVIWVIGYCLFERLSFLTNDLYTCIHLWVIHIHIHDSKWCNIHVHIFYVLKLGLYIIQKITITDDHFKRTNACMFDKNSEMLAHIIFILCWKSEIAGKKSLHLLHITLLKHRIPEKNML